MGKISYYVTVALNVLSFMDFLNKYDPDIICLQETKAHREQVEINLEKLDNNHISLPCKHHFHEKCITEWFNNKRDCPICRMKYRLVLTTKTYNAD